MPRHLPSLTLLACALALTACDRDAAAPATTDVAPADAPPVLDQPAQEVPPATVPPGTQMPGTKMPGDDVTADTGTGAGKASFAGFGTAEFGMDVAQVRAAWDGELDGNPNEGQGCFHLSPAGQPSIAWFALMFGDGKFVRYSVANDEMTAPGGGQRGMDIAEIESLYGEGIEHTPHKYVDGGEYLRIADPAGSDSVLIFETDAEGTVTEWRVGLPPHVDYVEGCA